MLKEEDGVQRVRHAHAARFEVEGERPGNRVFFFVDGRVRIKRERKSPVPRHPFNGWELNERFPHLFGRMNKEVNEQPPKTSP